MPQLFVYQWVIDDDKTKSIIRVYGKTEVGSTICLRIINFTPWTYIELSNDVIWTKSKIELIKEYLMKKLFNKKPISIDFARKRKLFGANIKDNKHILFPYLFLRFQHSSQISNLNYNLKLINNVSGLGNVKMIVQEGKINTITQLQCERKVPMTGWISFDGKKAKSKYSICDEYIADVSNIFPSDKIGICDFDIISFDIEVYSSVITSMPVVTKQSDCIFQISSIFQNSKEKENLLFSLGNIKPQNSEYSIIQCINEQDLLMQFVDYIRRRRPNIMIGYNILGFDLNYMIQRSEATCCYENFMLLGLQLDRICEEKKISWTSSAYRNQEFTFPDSEGIVYLDLLPIVRRDYKLNNYQLKTVSTHFLGETKDPITHIDIHNAFKLYLKDTTVEHHKLSVIGAYCIQDSVLVMRLLDKLQTLISLIEMSKITHVCIFDLITKGQQIKVFNQLYNYCFQENIVVESNPYEKNEESYEGAYVVDPIPGRYKDAVSLDFVQFYPSAIISHNLDYTSYISVELRDLIDRKLCYIIKFESHIGCEHDRKIIRKAELTNYFNIRKKKDRNEDDEELWEERSLLMKHKPKNILCKRNEHWFLKEPKGVLPTILENLMKSRAIAKKEMKNIKQKIENGDYLENEKGCLELEYTVLNARQNALKLSSNSVYGFCGTIHGYLPFIPIAACTTYLCQENIKKAQNEISEKHNGKIIYGDSVTSYTPVIIRHQNLIKIETIEKLAEKYGNNNWMKCIEEGKQDKESCELVNIETWSDIGWTKLFRVIRHNLSHTKKIIRVNTHSGVVDVTNDHSLLKLDKTEISPDNLKIGDSLLHSPFPKLDNICETYSMNEARIMGFFCGDGSAGNYDCPSGKKCSWALNNKNIKLLEYYKKLCEEVYSDLEWKILDTIDSSNVYKLVPKSNEVYQGIKKITMKYIDLLYYDKDKIIPITILNSSDEIRKSFWDGLYDANGDKENNITRIDQKSQISLAMFNLLGDSLGYNTSLNSRKDKTNISRLTLSRNCQRKDLNKIKKLYEIPYSGYVYDLTTENNHFQAGIGKMIVHNTDSVYVLFPEIKTKMELWDHAKYVANEINKLFIAPMAIEFEDTIFTFLLLFTKKRYVNLTSNREGKTSGKLNSKGVLLVRRDNSNCVRNIYSQVIYKISQDETLENILYFIIQEINGIFQRKIKYIDFVITKAVGDSDKITEFPEYIQVGDYKSKRLSNDPETRKQELKDKNVKTEEEYYMSNLPANVQLANKMRSRGIIVENGSRIEFVVIDRERYSDKICNKVEDYSHFKRYSQYLNIDYLYYTKALVTPLTQVIKLLSTKESKFMTNQLKYRINKEKMLQQIKNFSKPKLIIIE